MFNFIFSVHLVLFLLNYEVSSSIPPSACFAPFKWQDCGKAPTPVMYYWKPGSRCEVGLWRGCLPNINMFKDEYECVSTCIFSTRVGEEDYHKLNQLSAEIDYEEEHTTSEDNSTDTGDDTANGTEGNVSDSGNASDGGDGENDGGTTGAADGGEGEATTAAEGETTAAPTEAPPDA